jgi:hypothetical protein
VLINAILYCSDEQLRRILDRALRDDVVAKPSSAGFEEGFRQVSAVLDGHPYGLGYEMARGVGATQRCALRIVRELSKARAAPATQPAARRVLLRGDVRFAHIEQMKHYTVSLRPDAEPP